MYPDPTLEIRKLRLKEGAWRTIIRYTRVLHSDTFCGRNFTYKLCLINFCLIESSQGEARKELKFNKSTMTCALCFYMYI